MKTYIFTDSEGQETVIHASKFYENGEAFIYCSDEIETLRKLWNSASDKNKVIVAETEINNELEVMKLMGDNIKYKPIIVSYERSREYGGAEEGGWYYTCYSCPEEVESHENNEESGVYHVYDVTFDEIVFGENETINRPYYC
jgi:hypothetical protein